MTATDAVLILAVAAAALLALHFATKKRESNDVTWKQAATIVAAIV